MKKKKNKKDEAQVDPELKGLEIRVNEFGEIVTNLSVDRLNDFLDRKVVDRKLKEKMEKEMKQKSSGRKKNKG